MTNPFEILGLPRRFHLNDEELETRYLELSREHHPDANPGTSGEAQIAVLRKSAEINDAYRTLCEPWSRVDALIQLNDADAMDATKTLCPMFLMEAMEMRESTQEAPIEALPALEQSVQAKIDQYFADVVARLDDGEVREAATLLHQSNYYRKALSILLERMDRIAAES